MCIYNKIRIDNMSKLRNIIAIAVCKILIFVGKCMGKKGSSTPGAIALKISPGVLKYLASQVKGQIVMVCGTNGKTTTNNLLYSLLTNERLKVVCNNIGANMLPGVACAFIAKSSLFAKVDADCAAIECDEASLRKIIPHVKPDKIVITNLFRDQLDRYGEIDITIKLLNEAINNLEDVQLILNGDDPLCAQFGKNKNAVYYGIDENCNISVRETKEGRFCLNCGNELSYNYYHYSQLGDYYCTKCGFKRPKPNYAAREVKLGEETMFNLHTEKITVPIKIHYHGFYNIYNILAAVAAFNMCGYDIKNINSVFEKYKPQIGRMEPFVIGGKKVILNLSKNPAGFNQAIATLVSDERRKDVMIVLNDNAQDGRDVSWIWDVDYEKLKIANVDSLVASGIRKYDMAVRLKYAGFDEFEIMDNNIDTLKNISSKKGEVCYVLINYTALFDTQNNLKELQDKDLSDKKG